MIEQPVILCFAVGETPIFPVQLCFAAGETPSYPVTLRFVPGVRPSFPVRIDYTIPVVDSNAVEAHVFSATSLAAQLKATGRIAASVVSTSTASVSFDNRRFMTAHASSAASLSGLIGGRAGVIGAVNSTSTGAALLKGAGTITAHVVCSSTGAVSFGGQSFINASVTGATSLSVAVKGSGKMAGSITSNTTVSAGLSAKGSLAGAINGVGSLVAALSGKGGLAASTAGTATGTAAVTNSGGTSYDTDAQAFFTAASITNTTQKDAANQLVLDLKAAGIWTKMRAIYPIVGGNATAHAVNLKSPGTYDLTFVNSPTHDANGVDWNGTNQYATNGMTTGNFSDLTPLDFHFSVYLNDETPPSQYEPIGFYGDNGSADNGGVTIGVGFEGGDIMVINQPWRETTFIQYVVGNQKGFRIATRSSSTSQKGYYNGTLKGEDTSPTTATVFNGTMTLGGRNTGLESSTQRTCFASLGKNLTATEATSLNTMVEALQVTLSRGTQ